MNHLEDSLANGPTVLLTGGTGVFGAYLIRQILKDPTVRLVLLVRASSNEEAKERIKEYVEISVHIEVLCADLEKEHLGLKEDVYKSVTQKVTHILHAAASTRFNLSMEEARERNVQTTKRMLFFAQDCPMLERFGYVSSALVAGKRSGIIKEDEFEHNQGFLNTYQQSKYEAEALVRSYVSKLPIAIFRPPLLISPFSEGSRRPTNLLTMSVFLARKGFLPILPGTPDASFDIMDGEVVASVVASLLLKKSLSYTTYHVTSGANTLTVKDVIETVEGHLHEKLPFRFTGNIESFNTELHKLTRRNPILRVIYHKTSSFLPELAYPKIYDNRNTLEELGIKSIDHNAQKKLESIL